MNINIHKNDVNELNIINSTNLIDLNNISLHDYIQLKKVNFGDKTLTHQWWDNNKNTNFKIEDNEYDEFIELYYKQLKKDKILHVMEKPKDIGPMCLDFDFKQTSPERTICVDNIINIISIINNIIDANYKIDNIKTLESYIFMKHEPFYDKKKSLYSDGFHIMYPNLILSVEDRFLIYDESRKEIIKQDLFSDIYSVLVGVKKLISKNNEINSDSDNNLDNNLEDNIYNDYYKLTINEKDKINNEIFDPCVIQSNKWFMYGSGKKINNDINIYKLIYIFDYNVDEIEEKPKTKDLIKLLSIRKKSNEEKQIFSINNDEYKNKIKQIRLKYIKKSNEKININDLFLSNNNEEKIIINNEKKIVNNEKIIELMQENKYEKINIDDIEYCKKLINLLDPSRANLYDDWICVGWALYNISSKLLPEFIKFSKLDKNKFDYNSCLKVWENCSKRNDNSGYSLPSLVKWAMDDNIEGYKKLMRDKINTMLDKGDINTDFDVACIIKETYKYVYKCSSIQKNIWYQYDNHRWNRIDCAYTLSIKLSTELSIEFAKLHADIMQLAVTEVGQKSDLLQKKCKDIHTLIFNLKKSSFKERIIKECSILFYQKDFESKLDQNNYLIGFTNGVYDLKNKIFRNGSPDDLIGKTVGYSYKIFDKNDLIIKEVENFAESIQPEEDMRKYLMVYCSSFLEGSNKDQKFMIWTGCHAINQGIIMANCSIKKVQDIKIGEELMGDDFKPRKVLELIRGNDKMCEIIPDKGEKFKVNLDHILSIVSTSDTLKYYWNKKKNKYKLKWQELINGIPKQKIKNFYVKDKDIVNNKDYKKSNKQAKKEIYNFKKILLKNNLLIKKGDVIDISVKNYINYCINIGLNNYCLFKNANSIDLPEQYLDIDPYLYGQTLKNEIADKYILNSKKNRLKLLEGIIISKGKYQNNINECDIIIKSEKLSNNVLFLIRSLGFNSYKYIEQINNEIHFRINITNINSETIHLIHNNKYQTNKHLIQFKIIIKDENEDYYGFKVDKNHRYLMDCFTVTHNCGMNGKGTLIDLLDHTFNGASDGYFATLQPTVLTQKRASSSSASPELADKFGKRSLILQEPEGDDKINTGFMKNITGQDKIEARPLYGDPFQYTPQFKLLLACNHLPNIPTDDGGTWRRIRVIDFWIKFTSNPQNKNERKSDSKLRDKIKNWKQAFMWLLINVYYPIYVENDGLEKLEPERVKLSTNKYKADSNVFMEFCTEALEKDKESIISLNDIYEMFKTWYTNSYNDKKPLPRKKLKEYFNNNGFDIVSNTYGGNLKGFKAKDPSQVDVNDIDSFIQ